MPGHIYFIDVLLYENIHFTKIDCVYDYAQLMRYFETFRATQKALKESNFGGSGEEDYQNQD